MNSKERLSQKIICLFILFAVIISAPLIVITVWDSFFYKQKIMLLTHFKSLTILPAEIKYSLVFAIESLAEMKEVKLIPDYPADNGADFYNKVTYDTFSDTAKILEESVPAGFVDYIDIYKTVIYKNTCQVVPSLSNGKRILTRPMLD
jgi:hypothetical protein